MKVVLLNPHLSSWARYYPLGKMVSIDPTSGSIIHNVPHYLIELGHFMTVESD